MDYANAPAILATSWFIISDPTQLLPAITQGRRAVLLVNRGVTNVFISNSVTVGIAFGLSGAGFLLRPNEGIAVATMSEVWAGPGNAAGVVNMLVLAQ